MTTKPAIERTDLLAKIDGVFGSSYDLHQVTRRIFKETSKICDTSNFYIAIYHKPENMISFDIYTMHGKEYRPFSRTLSGGMTEYVLRSKKPLRLGQNLMSFCRKHRIRLLGKPAKSWLGVPMIYKNNVEGVMTVQDYACDNRYSQADEELLTNIANRAAIVIANTRLLDNEVKRAKELSLMNHIAQRLTKSLDLKMIIECTTGSIIKYFKKFNVAIFVRENNELILRKLSRGFVDVVPRDIVLKIGQGIVGKAAQFSKSVIANNIRDYSYYVDFGQTSTKSELAVPLKISRKIIGVLDIQCNELNAFNPNTVRILELIADRLSVAIHNARLYQNAMAYTKELTVSFAIAQSTVSSLDLDDMLKRVVAVIRKTMEYSDCAILLKNREKNELYIRAAHGYSQKVVKSTRLKIDRYQGITGYVAATGKPHYSPDVTKSKFYSCWKKSIRSELAVPLKIKDETIGVLDLESDKLDAFTDKDMRVFSVVASQIAIAIENARLYNETKRLSLTDTVTHIPNRRHFNLVFDNEMKKARSYSRPLSIAMIDIDDLKSFNDRYGHPSGDRTLLTIARILKDSVRDTDLVARYGGDEFIIVFPETFLQAAVKVADRVRNAISKKSMLIRGHGRKKITVSIGVAAFPLNAQDGSELVKQADSALYRAKNKGKNQVQTV